jgi:ABC-2 type transport system permease protein
MSRTVRVLRAELAWLARSRVAWLGIVTLLALSGIAALSSTAHVADERAQREAQQQASDAAFDGQPNRHPHRMVHYGTYAHRPLGPLAAFDPGTDPFTGTLVYLEGHRQNSATFSAARASSSLIRFGQLTPAFVLQVLLPLLLVFLGFQTIAREREAGTLQQLRAHGAGAGEIVLGKALALGLVAALALLPAAASLAGAAGAGAHPGDGVAAIGLLLGHATWLAAWTVAIVAVSALAPSGRTALLVLVSAWLLIVVLVPRGAAAAAEHLAPLPSRAATDLLIQQQLRTIGDSHDADDPYFEAFKRRTLAQYGVDRVEDLPFNYRGRLAREGEALTSRLFVAHAQATADLQRAQVRVLDGFAALSPMLALRRLSTAAAGTDLENHLRFLAQAEQHRYAMVQSLNLLHERALSHADDAARSRDANAERRTRVDAANWSRVPDFRFEPASAAERLGAAASAAAWLAAWCAAILALGVVAVRRLQAASS